MKSLNKKQKAAIWFGLILLLIVFFYPPWVNVVTTGNQRFAVHYEFLFSEWSVPRIIYQEQLYLEVICTVFFTLGLIFVFKD